MNWILGKIQSDRHGFNNPDYVWAKNIDIVFIGDSATKGECVNQGDEMASQLRIFQKIWTWLISGGKLLVH